ncbi:MAG: hypothetical protein Q9205_007551 [Flavoplaca limonia]
MDSPQNIQHEPVAIVGMGCRWPGGVRDSPGFWDFLRNKVDGWKEFDDPRFSTRGFHHPNSDRPGSVAMKGAFLSEEDARLFDHSFFGMTGLEVETLDPSQRKLLEVAYEAIENAGDTWSSVSGTLARLGQPKVSKFRSPSTPQPLSLLTLELLLAYPFAWWSGSPS